MEIPWLPVSAFCHSMTFYGVFMTFHDIAYYSIIQFESPEFSMNFHDIIFTSMTFYGCLEPKLPPNYIKLASNNFMYDQQKNLMMILFPNLAAEK